MSALRLSIVVILAALPFACDRAESPSVTERARTQPLDGMPAPAVTPEMSDPAPAAEVEIPPAVAPEEPVPAEPPAPAEEPAPAPVDGWDPPASPMDSPRRSISEMDEPRNNAVSEIEDRPSEPAPRKDGADPITREPTDR